MAIILVVLAAHGDLKGHRDQAVTQEDLQVLLVQVVIREALQVYQDLGRAVIQAVLKALAVSQDDQADLDTWVHQDHKDLKGLLDLLALQVLLDHRQDLKYLVAPVVT